jgi:hypothetical protein
MVRLPAAGQTFPGSVGCQGHGLRLAARSSTASVAGKNSQLGPAGDPTSQSDEDAQKAEA